MTEQPIEVPRKLPQPSRIWPIGIMVVMLVAGYFGGKYFEHDRPLTPRTKLQVAVEAFKSGYDQTAIPLLTTLANEGNPNAQYWLADIDENGLGVKRDIKGAVGLLEKSAAQGFVPAERHLGELYLRGNETLQNFVKAQSWLTKAADIGDGVAQREVGDIFALGLGVMRDLPTAYGWYENATLAGDGLAKHLRNELVMRMSPTDIAKGEQLAKNIASGINAGK